MYREVKNLGDKEIVVSARRDGIGSQDIPIPNAEPKNIRSQTSILVHGLPMEYGRAARGTQGGWHEERTTLTTGGLRA